jgi:flagellar basal body-associated protein FliL
MADEKAEAAEAEIPAGPKMILGMPIPKLAFFLANLIVMCGGLAFIIHATLIYKKPVITDDDAVREIKRKEAAIRKHLDESGYFTESYPEMTISLKGEQGGKSHYATVEITVVCGSDNCQDQLRENKAKVEDTIQTVLGARSYTELGSLDVKFRVKHEI